MIAVRKDLIGEEEMAVSSEAAALSGEPVILSLDA